MVKSDLLLGKPGWDTVTTRGMAGGRLERTSSSGARDPVILRPRQRSTVRVSAGYIGFSTARSPKTEGGRASLLR